MTTAEFSSKIKTKYPQYASLDDATLTSKMVTKFPQYKTQISDYSDSPVPKPQQGWQDPGSQFGQNQLPELAKGAIKGVGSTLTGLGQVVDQVSGSGLARTLMQDPVQQAQQAGVEQMKQRYLTPNNDAQKAGFTGEQIGEFFLPGIGEEKASEKAPGVLEKLGGLAAKSGKEAAQMGGVSLAQQGKLNSDVVTNAAIGGAFPVAGAALKSLGGVGKEVAKNFFGLLSGVPADAIEHALKNPEAVQKAITSAAKSGGDTTAQQIYKDATDALDSLKKARSTAFEEKLTNIKGNTADVKLSTQGIKDATQKTVEDFGGTMKGKVLDASGMAIDKSHANKLQELINRIHSWADPSPTGVNKLRQIVDGYKLGGINLGSSEKQFNAMVGKLRTNLSQYVEKEVPAFKAMNSEYAAHSKVLDDIRSQLKIGSKDPNTALRKLLNVFNPKSTVYRPIVQELGEKGGKDLMSDIAGLVMSKWTPEGLGKYLMPFTEGAALTHPGAALTVPATLAASSPRVVGEAATRLGKLGQQVDKLPLAQGSDALKSLLAKKKY